MSKSAKKTIRRKLSDYFRANLGMIVLLVAVIAFAVLIYNLRNQIILVFSQQSEDVLSSAFVLMGVLGESLGIALVLFAILFLRLLRIFDIFDVDKYQNQKPQKLFEYDKTMSKQQNKYVNKIMIFLIPEFVLAMVVMFVAMGIIRDDSSMFTDVVLLAITAAVFFSTFFIWYFYGKAKGLIKTKKGKKK